MARHVICPKCDTELIVRRMPADFKVPCPNCKVRIRLAETSDDDYDDEEDYAPPPPPRRRRRTTRSRKSSSSFDPVRYVIFALVIAGTVGGVLGAVKVVSMRRDAQDDRPRIADNMQQDPPPPNRDSDRDRERGRGRGQRRSSDGWYVHKFSKHDADVEFPVEEIDSNDSSRAETAVARHLGTTYIAIATRLTSLTGKSKEQCASYLDKFIEGELNSMKTLVPGIRPVGQKQYMLSGPIVGVRFELVANVQGMELHQMHQVMVARDTGLCVSLSVQGGTLRPAEIEQYFDGLRIQGMTGG